MKHTMGFRYFSVAYTEVKKNPFKEPQATFCAIFKGSVLFVSGLENVNLSGQSISNLSYKARTSCVFDPKRLLCVKRLIPNFFL